MQSMYVAITQYRDSYLKILGASRISLTLITWAHLACVVFMGQCVKSFAQEGCAKGLWVLIHFRY